MTLAEAAATYALIAIGDGLVSQIPSLCIAVAAGLVVTRVASEKEEDSLGTEIGTQFFGQAQALCVVAGLCVALALMPGMPHLTFLALAAARGARACARLRRPRGAAGGRLPKPRRLPTAAAAPAACRGSRPRARRPPWAWPR